MTRALRWSAVLLATATAAVLAATGPASADQPLTAAEARALAGQRVIYSYPGLEPPPALFDRIRAGEAAGVIFFTENVDSLEQIAGVVDQLKAAAAESPNAAPLLLMTDQEGGQIRRLPGEPYASHKEIGEAADAPATATVAGRGAGENLAGVGMNVNLAPVLDVYREPGDLMDQFERSFSTDPGVAGELGANYLTAQQEAGVAATVKHFPGLGTASSSENTDEGPATLPVSASELREVDEAPYQQAISAGAKLVMLSWATYPALDADLPAGLSPTVVDGELRQRLGYTGVTITDALEAGALTEFGSAGERGVLAAGAGMDLLLASARDVDQGVEIVDGLAGALADGSLDQGAFDEAVARVDALRTSLG